MTEHTDDFATRPDAIPELMALADKCGPHAVAVLIALDRWQAAIITEAEQVTVERIAAWLEGNRMLDWLTLADVIRRGDWKDRA